MLVPMERRGFLRASLIGGAGLAAAPAVAEAQRRRRSRCVERPDWTEAGPPDGREPRDPTAPSAEERLHVPVLALPERVPLGRAFDLAVRVGLEMHPMDPQHRIGWIDAFVGSERAWVIDLGPHVPYPVARVPMRVLASTEVTVRAWCNEHGVWRTRWRVEVG